jgi:hypothetical protein
METATNQLVDEISGVLTKYSLALLHIEGIKRTLDILGEHHREIVTSPEAVTKITDLLKAQTDELNRVVGDLSK